MKKGLFILAFALMFCGAVFGQDKPEKTISKTLSTKSFVVNDLNDLLLSDCADGHFIVIEKKKHQGHVFDAEGNLTGEFRTSVRYQVLNHNPVFSEGKAVVLIEEKGATIFDDNWITATVDYNGNVLATIAQMGNRAALFPGVLVDGLTGIGYGGDEMLRMQFDRDRAKCYLIDATGKRVQEVGVKSFVSEETLLTPHPLVDGRRLFHKERYGYLDKAGAIAIAPQYVSASDYSEGLAAVAIRDGDVLKWGFIDTNGKTVIDPMFTNKPDDFHEGLAAVKKKNGKYVFIDKTGTVVSPEFGYATRFLGGYAVVGDQEPYEWLGSSAVYSVDKAFQPTEKAKWKIAFLPKSFDSESNTIFFGKDLFSDGKVYASSGELILSDVGPFHEGVAWSQKNHCYVNLQGVIIVQFVESEF